MVWPNRFLTISRHRRLNLQLNQDTLVLLDSTTPQAQFFQIKHSHCLAMFSVGKVFPYRRWSL